MYLDINLELLSGRNTQKEKTEYSGFVKLGLRWAEWDSVYEKVAWY